MDRRFSCTACGKCCHGVLPLTVADALRHADRFPLVVVWTPVRQGARSFDATAALGIVIDLPGRRKAAVQIAPMAYIPPAFPCPELTTEGLCGIHATKPQRCKTMPFSAARDEADQDDLLLPRPGWTCDTSPAAPLVYRDRTIVERADFDAERAMLTGDAAILAPYATRLLAAQPAVGADLRKVATKPSGGQIVLSFSTLIPRLPKVDIYDFADQQLPVARSFAERTKGEAALAAFHRRYAELATEWGKIAASRSGVADGRT